MVSTLEMNEAPVYSLITTKAMLQNWFSTLKCTAFSNDMLLSPPSGRSWKWPSNTILWLDCPNQIKHRIMTLLNLSLDHCISLVTVSTGSQNLWDMSQMICWKGPCMSTIMHWIQTTSPRHITIVSILTWIEDRHKRNLNNNAYRIPSL